MTSQKYALSLFKSKVNWCPKKLRWNLVIFQVSGYLKLPQQKNFPWQSKHGPKDSTNIRVLFCKTKRGGKRSSHYSGGPFTNHCQQRPHKGIETKKKFELTKHGCLGSSKKQGQSVTLFKRDVLIIREQSNFLSSGHISRIYPDYKGKIIDCNCQQTKSLFQPVFVH